MRSASLTRGIPRSFAKINEIYEKVSATRSRDADAKHG